MSEHSEQPYISLGKHLRYLREQHAESVAEVSGAVEIDERVLERIEAGHERPAEDILMLLISHFDMQDQEAVQLWELAGYEGEAPQNNESSTPDNKQVVVLLGIDARTMYSDAYEVNIDQNGVTMTFGQGAQRVPVAKLGMSHQQAEQVLAVLQTALLHAKYGHGPKQLPPGVDTQSSS